MFINIKTGRGFMPDEVMEEMENIEFPAVLLDKNLKVLKKNSASRKFESLRKGMKFSRFLTESDEAKIRLMSLGETLFLAVANQNSEFRANVICGVDCHLVLMRVGSMKLRDAVVEKYQRMSGYDSTMIANDLLIDNEKHISAIEGIVVEALFKQLSPRTLPFFNALTITNGILGEFANTFSDFLSRVTVKISQDELVSEGDEKDFALMFAAMVSLCLDFAENEIRIELRNEGDELVVSLVADVDVSDYGIARLTSLDKNESMLDAADELGFLTYMLKLLSDCNLWDFLVTCKDGQLRFSLRTPYVKRGEEFMVHDISTLYIKKLVKAFSS